MFKLTIRTFLICNAKIQQKFDSPTGLEPACDGLQPTT